MGNTYLVISVILVAIAFIISFFTKSKNSSMAATATAIFLLTGVGAFVMLFCLAPDAIYKENQSALHTYFETEAGTDKTIEWMVEPK